ncbi:tRNA (mnm(5)s(2)U34)-methyltransferase [Tuanshanicoccus lijuaniae]|uniref:tRNA (mnm(5)s(2)U34)-methyltransferase n=1 Tax=Aerococcaceae bacterium zg-1292 TaxID=2774330 RepID=UPI001BD8759D|nr:class I SAM-dependent methyltransferase [Aerococcaceae bacterium zg-BR22]MBS4455539.1 class I SAM-dependent methyltransferase [Aerococcaceae bacterium zg-A91]MBS4457158.1 class I SAM-dependent methyltransferase [Aerococcaceae bacterium zg-BR33]
MLRALHYSHHLLNELITTFPNGVFIDGTLGKGNDTLRILNHPDFKGEVYAFDIQQAAIDQSVAKINPHPSANHAHLILDSHANLAKYVTEDVIHGAIFNLGYLPGGDHSITTQFDSTLQAIHAIAERLVPHGQLILVIYSGHPQGKIEKEKLMEALSLWPQEDYQVLQYGFINQRNHPPMLLVVEKL